MKYAVEMGSVAMIYIPSFIKIGSSIQKLVGEYTDIASMVT
jgi:putative Mn2+ efflux pump MntP